jgi:hypothetical protein
MPPKCSPARFMQDMKSLGEYVQKATGSLPKLVLVILPISSVDIYLAVKQFGDVHVGVRALTVLKKNPSHTYIFVYNVGADTVRCKSCCGVRNLDYILTIFIHSARKQD